MTTSVSSPDFVAAPVVRNRTSLTALLFAGLVALFTGTALLPSLSNGFVDWDDPPTIVENPNIRSLSWPHIRWMFTTFHMGHYQPLSWLSLALDYRVWGSNPLGFHLTNLLLHAAAAVSFFVVCRRLLVLAIPQSDARPITLCGCAALAALVFSVHPLRVESVAWATERRDVLAGLFAIGAVAAYLRAVERRATAAGDAKWLAAAWLLFAASLLAKASAMLLPAVLTVLDFYPIRRLHGPWREAFSPQARLVWIEKLPFWLAGGVAAALAITAQHVTGALESVASFGPLDRMALVVFGVAFYIWKTVVPLGLSPLYELPAAVDPWRFEFLVAGAMSIVVTTGLIRYRRRVPAILAAWVCYLVLLAPVSGIAQSGPQMAADRYTYLPCLGFASLLGGVLAGCLFAIDRAGRWSGAAACALLAGGAAGLGSLTWQQTKLWRDSETLWRRAAAIDPESSVALASLGRVLAEAGQVDAGRTLLEKAIELRPMKADAHINLSTLLRQEGDTDAAREHYLEAWRLQPRSADVAYNLGLLDQEQGEWESAAEWYERSLAIQPDYRKSLQNLWLVYEQLGQRDRAIVLYEQAVRRDPTNAEAFSILGVLLRRAGDAETAIGYFLKAWKLHPQSADVCYHLGLSYHDLGEWHLSANWFERAVAAQPGFVRAMNDLGIVRRRLGQLDRAIAIYQAALDLDPTDKDVRYNLAIALTDHGAEEAAEGEYRRVLELDPEHIGASNNLALLLERRGQFVAATEILAESLVRNPEHPLLLYNLSWLLATAPDAAARDGVKAVALAVQLVEQTDSAEPQALDALAAAYAESGRFDEAVETSTRASGLAAEQGRQSLATQIISRRELYRASRPFHMSPTQSPPAD